MSFELQPFTSINLTRPLLDLLIEEHQRDAMPRFQRLWSYYRNALAEPTLNGGSIGPPAQRVGLPKRLLEPQRLKQPHDLARELVIENDIAWRVHALVDFMFPAEPRLISRARDAALSRTIETVLARIIQHNGGIALWQHAALLGSIYGHVDWLVRTDALPRARMQASVITNAAAHAHAHAHAATNPGPPPVDHADDRPGIAPSETASDLADLIGRHVTIETIEAPRAIAMINEDDYRQLDALIIHYRRPVHDVEHTTMLDRVSRRLALRRRRLSQPPLQPHSTQRAQRIITEIHSATHSQRYEEGVLISEAINRTGRVPVVHVQNLPQPFAFSGLSDVEPLIPLQDELNTRLSDRANRVTMQSFRMWLGKGIETFIDRPIGPGQMWMTDNVDASIEAFGGDADAPSEQAHLNDLREALDKASGVTPAAAGHINAKVGNLTSENALRISLMGTIAKIKRKRITYGQGMAALCELILHALDAHGLLHTQPHDRHVDITWADPLPPDQTRTLHDALLKQQLGVPTEQLRVELGYP